MLNFKGVFMASIAPLLTAVNNERVKDLDVSILLSPGASGSENQITRSARVTGNEAKKSPSAAALSGVPAALFPNSPIAVAISPDVLSALVLGTNSTISASRRILSDAVEQATFDRKSGVPLRFGMKVFSRNVSGLAEQIALRANAGQTIAAEQLGEIAQQYALASARDSLLSGASSIFNVPEGALAERSTFQLLLDNLGWSDQSSSTAVSGQNHGALTARGNAALGAGAGVTGLAEGASVSSQVFGAVGAAYGAYKVLANWGNSDPVSGAINGFTAGAYLGGAIGGGPFGAAVGGVIGGAVGLIGSFFSKSGKSKDQRARDQVRSLLQQSGVINSKWQVALANGDLYDIGKDGKAELSNTDGTVRRAYDVDFGNPLAGQTVAMLQPLSFIITGGDPKLSNDFTGYFTNAALSNAKNIEDARKNALAIFKAMNVDAQKVAQTIVALAEQGRISEDTARAYLSGFTYLIDGAKKTATKAKTTAANKSA